MTTARSSDAGDGRRRRSAPSSRPPAPATTSASSSTSSIEAGRVGRPHGLDGSFYVTRPEASLLVSPLTLDRPREIVRRAGTDAAPILRLEGIGTRGEIEAFRGQPLLVPREVVELEADEFLAADLVGCAVVDGAAAVGEVERVLAYPSCDLLVVGELLIPLIDDAVRSIDLDARVIDVDRGFLGAG